MTESTARRGAPRGKRPPRRSDDSSSRDHVNKSNLTTTNSLPPVEAPTGFFELGVPARIDDGLAACGFAQPFNIQTEAVPVAMQGNDVCGRAIGRSIDRSIASVRRRNREARRRVALFRLSF